MGGGEWGGRWLRGFTFSFPQKEWEQSQSHCLCLFRLACLVDQWPCMEGNSPPRITPRQGRGIRPGVGPFHRIFKTSSAAEAHIYCPLRRAGRQNKVQQATWSRFEHKNGEAVYRPLGRAIARTKIRRGRGGLGSEGHTHSSADALSAMESLLSIYLLFLFSLFSFVLSSSSFALSVLH